MKATLKQGNVPKLEGWQTFPEIAEVLGVSAGQVGHMYHAGRFGDAVRRVGAAALIVPDHVVEKLVEGKVASLTEKRDQLRANIKSVKRQTLIVNGYESNESHVLFMKEQMDALESRLSEVEKQLRKLKLRPYSSRT